MKYRYWFLQLQGIGNRMKHILIQNFYHADAIYHMTEEAWHSFGLLQPPQLQALLAGKRSWDLDGEYQKFLQTGESFVTLEDAAYPVLLRQVYDAPYGLYFRGRLPSSEEKLIAMVGARRCSAYGRKVAEELAEFLGQHGYRVVSGMAKGIDTCSHVGCLRSGSPTIAVLGCGVDVCYPPENRQIYHQIAQNGCLLSEYPPHSQPLARQFPPRNRIISGISRCVIVVEAREKSGSLITADYALEQGKEIYVVPGRMTDAMSVGCNRLIAQGAGIITSPEGFLEEIEGTSFLGVHTEGLPHANYFSLEKDESLVYSCFDFYPKSIEQVLEESGMDLLCLLSVIMDLCDKGLLRECFKNQYIRCQ